MNTERIKELAKEAGYYLYDLTETHECKTVETDSADEWITLEKFAELIVKECLGDFKDRIAKRYQGSDRDRDVAYGMEIVYSNIRDKFGVNK